MTAFLTVFLSMFVIELADKSQLATALFAAESNRSPLLILFASSAALAASAGLATTAGSLARDHVLGAFKSL
jgi:putative Ca2+/H+ antiporter (TMEM165/GDT1 family)